MTDQRAFVFGSFTEDETKSFKRQLQVTDIEIKFGSLDSETLRSVGIVNTEVTEAEFSKGWPLKLVNKENAGTVCTTESKSKKVFTTVDENGSIHSKYPVSDRHSYGIKELKTDNGAPLSKTVSDLSKLSSPEHHVSKGLSIHTLVDTEALVDSSVGVDLIDSDDSTPKASNELGATVRNLSPRGLVNLGNLCFLNSTLQALLSCPPFVLLLQELRAYTIPKGSYPTLHAFAEFISDFDTPMDSSSKRKETVLEIGRPLRPVMFESTLKTFTPDVPSSIFGRPRQEDAQEFLSFVMHQLHDELLKLEGQIPSGSGGRDSLVLSTDDDDDSNNWETVGHKNRTAITRTQNFIPSRLSVIFGGQMKSVVKARGSKASATVQPFLLLHLNICPDPVCSIEDALRLFSAPETLEGYRTSAAGKAEVVTASKSVKLMELPGIMVLHLMRFSYGSEGSTKLHKPVRFPLKLFVGRELLVSPSSVVRRYELVATITHHGREPSKGHYTADSRHPNGKWLHYDDASVTVIPTSKVLHEQAYVLFYRQL